MSQTKEVAKRVNIVRVKMVREASLLYPQRRIRMARDVVELFQTFLQETDREQFFLLCLNTKNEPTALHNVSIGSLDASIVHPREVFKVAILSNAAVFRKSKIQRIAADLCIGTANAEDYDDLTPDSAFRSR
ncbi:JAB domain-containing protein [Brevibacillus agri]|uniref:JAB domain-containing protein n=2 Tax=Brevibacillus agri TaxID=51101 RepID=UPI002E2131AF|nr:JAB domain-containing protein [Brevibacillus agri]